ncbi:WD40-repeat-containing domain protein [Endogone sp. FLAS-F59071]|nr:WD40-repeat-containing domain protein [Endogone sp. FLAS-F59071]|eukprot:RUS13758.1 WD40-repeat-containing domain protein [Endogone sp. FLAS-F59071]
MFCAISGEPPEVPVVSTKSGNVYEKRLITKYINDKGKDPITNEDLTLEDLVEINATPKTVKPRPPTVTSIPSLLSVFQNEWDSLMLETFTLKQQYQQVRQELSHALYQHDAACRVIARLVKERDAAREALANVQAHLGVAPSTDAAVPEQGTAMEVEVESGLPAEVTEKMAQTSAEYVSSSNAVTSFHSPLILTNLPPHRLSETRKKRKPPKEGYTSADAIKTYKLLSSVPSLHLSRPPGISAIDLDRGRDLVLTGGYDKHVHIYNRDEDKVIATLKGHTKKVNAVAWRGRVDDEHDIAISAGADKTVRVWAPGEKGHALAHTIQCHNGEVTDVTVHPSKEYFVSAGLDSTWAFHDLSTGKMYVQATDPETQTGYSSVQFHPDGMILGTGTDAVVRIWDVRAQQNIATFPGHTGKVGALAFSENGYMLATASQDNLVKLWDLRNLVNTKTLTLADDYKVHTLDFDYHAQYLAVGGTDVRIFKAKQWTELVKLEDNSGEIMGVKWGDMAGYLVTGGLDRTLRFYGPAAAE